MRMKLDAAEIDDESKASGIVDDHLLGRPPRGKGKGDRAQPRRPPGRCALLVERLAFGTVDEALQDDRAVADAGERSRGDGKEIPDEVELGQPGLAREIGLVGMGGADLATVNLEHYCV